MIRLHLIMLGFLPFLSSALLLIRLRSILGPIVPSLFSSQLFLPFGPRPRTTSISQYQIFLLCAPPAGTALGLTFHLPSDISSLFVSEASYPSRQRLWFFISIRLQ